MGVFFPLALKTRCSRVFPQIACRSHAGAFLLELFSGGVQMRFSGKADQPLANRHRSYTCVSRRLVVLRSRYKLQSHASVGASCTSTEWYRHGWVNDERCIVHTDLIYCVFDLFTHHLQARGTVLCNHSNNWGKKMTVQHSGAKRRHSIHGLIAPSEPPLGVCFFFFFLWAECFSLVCGFLHALALLM